MDKKKTGRKPKPESKKVRQKKVYLTDEQEEDILNKRKQPHLTAVLLNLKPIKS